MPAAYPYDEETTASLHLRSDGTIDCEFYIQRGRERRGKCHYEKNLDQVYSPTSERLSFVVSKVTQRASVLVTIGGLVSGMAWVAGGGLT